MISVWFLWGVIVLYVGLSWFTNWMHKKQIKSMQGLVDAQHRLVKVLYRENNMHRARGGFPVANIPDLEDDESGEGWHKK